MFRPTDPQLSLLESRFLVGPKKRERLERSRAEAFRTKILPLMDEEAFRACFHQDNGRPNKSIRLLVGLHILKEADDLTDEQVLDALEFNIQWQHALGVDPATAHVAERTLYYVRHKLMENERAQRVFEQVTQAMMKMDGLSAARQRLDSTHVISNIAVLTRLGLFTETITVFLRELRREAPVTLAKLDSPLLNRYLEREGYFGDATREQAQRRLPVVAQDLFALVKRFEADAEVKGLSSYGLLVRLLGEPCDVTEGEATTAAATVKEGEEVAGTSLQSPHDPDATYGHKGKGYEVQVAETCVKDNAYQVITAVEVNGAHASDQNATVPIVEKLIADGNRPDELLADTGYGSGENIVECAELGVALVAPVQDPHAPERPERRRGDRVPETPASDAGSDPMTPEQASEAPAGSPTTREMTFGDFAFNATFSEGISCPNGVSPTERSLSDDRTLRWRDTKAATATRQRAQQTPAFKEGYKLRSGIESTHAELKRRHGLGDVRVRGVAGSDWWSCSRRWRST